MRALLIVCKIAILSERHHAETVLIEDAGPGMALLFRDSAP